MLPIATIRPVAPRLPTFALPVTLNVPPVLKFPADAVPLTDSEVSVPTEVTLGCAAVVTVPAVVALPDMLPTILPEIVTEVAFALMVCAPI